MIGAIIGDIAGSRFEFRNTFDYNFELFHKDCSFTDDTICTIAIADAILKEIPYKDSILYWCRKYPHPMGAYGASFSRWLASSDPQPYDSFGNGAAMRVSPIGWAFSSDSEIFSEAKKSAECSHSHKEGIKGAQVISLAVYGLAYYPFERAKEYVQDICKCFYGEDYSNNLPKVGEWNETCQGCVPLAIHLFLQSDSFEDAIRKAISYGGDSDTLGAIVGSLAGAYYTIPIEMVSTASNYLPDEMVKVIQDFDNRFGIDDFYLKL